MSKSVARTLNQIPSVLSTSVVSLDDRRGGSPGDIALIRSQDDPKQINIVYGNKKDANSLSICKLPRQIPLESTSAKITIDPMSADPGRSICTLVMNSNSARLYESDERRAAQHLPLVVWKDTVALRVSPESGYLMPAGQDPEDNHWTGVIINKNVGE